MSWILGFLSEPAWPHVAPLGVGCRNAAVHVLPGAAATLGALPNSVTWSTALAIASPAAKLWRQSLNSMLIVPLGSKVYIRRHSIQGCLAVPGVIGRQAVIFPRKARHWRK